jgi:DNA-3-methyladenine glycosylase I
VTEKNLSLFHDRSADKNVVRCEWAGPDPVYLKYHDEEWGVPVYDDTMQFEFLILEGAQAGLSWITILKRREGYRKVFHNFDAKLVSKMNEDEIQSALQNPGIIRNKLKVRAAVTNARVFLQIVSEFGTFTNYIWRFVDNKPVVNNWKNTSQVPAKTEISDKLSADLKKRGMKFVGSTIMYAHMQATGLVNDHLVTCFRHKQL